jgi:hypothetical protein
MLKAVKYFGDVGIGVTSPQLFRADDRKIYVVKLQYGQLGSKVLANEFIAAKIGGIMGLCFPFSDIIEITEEIISQSSHLTRLGAIPGLHFASRFLNHTEYMKKNNLNKAVNTLEMAGVILFDHMFHNSDRNNNTKNILLRKEHTGFRIYAIDNSHLIRSGKWTLKTINSLSGAIFPYCRQSYGLLLKDHLSPQDFLPYIEKVANISDEDIESLVQQIPGEWLPDSAERQALEKFITIRKGMVEKVWDVLCNHIPKSRGGRQWWHSKK